MFIDADFSYLRADDYIVLEVYAVLDPDEFNKIYDDRILKKLLVAYMKKQCGTNMSKFQGVKLPGGIMLRGVEIYQEAMQEIEMAENELRSTFEIPSNFITG